MSLKLGIVAGEPSGDRLGAGLLTAVAERCPVTSFGIGGPELEAAGLESQLELQQLSMHGFAGPLRRLPFLWRTLKQVQEQMLDERVDVFVGVDFNVFNLLLESRLKRLGIPCVHYVSPSVYAWRQGRTRRVARSADVLLTLFPFEPPLYAGQSLRAVFVGHPLADDIPQTAGQKSIQRTTARAELALADDDTVITLMPGSRMSEVTQMLEVFLQSALELQRQHPAARFFVPCATAAIAAVVQRRLEDPAFSALPVVLSPGNARELLAASDAALIKSGTSTLEAMLLGVPMVVAYRLPNLTYQLVRRLLRTDYVALPNILAGEALVPELLQQEMQPLALARALGEQLAPSNRGALRARFAQIHESLACDANQRAAQEVLALATSRGWRSPSTVPQASSDPDGV